MVVRPTVSRRQALIDAGELECKRYQAANFVDTFNIADDTNISLLNNGQIQSKNSIQCQGGLKVLSDGSTPTVRYVGKIAEVRKIKRDGRLQLHHRGHCFFKHLTTPAAGLEIRFDLPEPVNKLIVFKR